MFESRFVDELRRMVWDLVSVTPSLTETTRSRVLREIPTFSYEDLCKVHTILLVDAAKRLKMEEEYQIARQKVEQEQEIAWLAFDRVSP